MFGELGVGDCIPREELVLIMKLKELNERVIEVSCGMKHVTCRTALHKIYTWGIGN